MPTCATVAATVGKFPVLLSKLVTFRAPPETDAIMAHSPKSDRSRSGASRPLASMQYRIARPLECVSETSR